jgi:biopolymer transport protein TolR
MANHPGVAQKSEINITPLIDVMLVLLIIFMVITPLTHHAVDTSIPQSAREGSTTPPSVTLVVGPEGPVLDGRRVPMEDLESHCRELFAFRADKTLFLRASGEVSYGTVVTALDAARGGGVERIGIITGSAARPPQVH